MKQFLTSFILVLLVSNTSYNILNFFFSSKILINYATFFITLAMLLASFKQQDDPYKYKK